MVCSECTLLEMNNIYIVDLLHPNSRLEEGLIDKQSIKITDCLTITVCLYMDYLLLYKKQRTMNQYQQQSTTLK